MARRLRAARYPGVGKLPTRVRGLSSLAAEIQRVFEANHRAHGAGRIWRQLDQEGIVADRYTVAKLMRIMGLQVGVHGKQTGSPGVGQPADAPTDAVAVPRRGAPTLVLLQGGQRLDG